MHAQASTDQSTTKRILIAEDNSDTRETLTLLLESKGFAVDSVSTCDDVIPRVKGTLPDLLISDVMMPSRKGLDGFEVCRQLKETLSHHCPKIILLTAIGKGTDTDAETIKQSTGADYYIPKPFEPDHLLTIIQNLFD